jgi:hypothetical protein
MRPGPARKIPNITDGQAVQHRAGQPDRGLRGGRYRQAQAEGGRDLPGSRGTGEPDPRDGFLRGQLRRVGRGHVDVHAGHGGVDLVQQPGGEFLRGARGHDLVGGPEKLR